MGKVFSKKKKEKHELPQTNPKIQNNQEKNIPIKEEEVKDQPENNRIYVPDRAFDDTPIPEPYRAPGNSPFLTIPEVKESLGSIDGIPIWNPDDMFWQEKFDDLGLLDDDFINDLVKMEKIKIKDMTKKQVCEFVTFYMRTGTFSKGVSNGDIPRLAKRYNDLIKLEKKENLPEEEEEITYPPGYDAEENSNLLTVFQKIPCFFIDGKVKVEEKHIRWSERFKKMGLYNDNCDDISDIQDKRIEKMNKDEVIKFMSYYVKKEMIPQGIRNGDMGRLAKRYNDIVTNEE